MNPIVNQVVDHLINGEFNVYILQCYFVYHNNESHKHIRGIYTTIDSFNKGLSELKSDLLRTTWFASNMLIEGHVIPVNKLGYGWLDDEEHCFHKENYSYKISPEEYEELFGNESP